ncbi:MAG: phage portal protein [Clostridiales bacterium]|nr:phage portal protein [Clostridiales bacterium]MBQ1571426.1 phage portal protein [Clostridiales bacterium]
MGLFDFLFRRQPSTDRLKYEGVFKMLNGYTPRFTSWSGGLYESELIRSAIHANATHISKLKVEMHGAAKPALKVKMQHAPNSFQTWSQFLQRLSTILDVHNTAFITPILDDYGQVSGIYTPLPHKCEIVQFSGKPYVRYEFSNGEHAAIELENCGIMVQHQYKSDLLGESNHALFPTMELINIQNQGIEEGVKSAASYRFWAKLNNFTKVTDIAKERKRFTEQNFSKDAEAGGILLFPNTYDDVHQVDVKPWVIDSEQMQIIKDNVFEYFGVNEDILQNKAIGDAWSAYYEGKCEPFAIQMSEVLSKMLYTFREQSQGNKVMVTANRLQYMSNQDKLNVSSQMLDRGIMSINDVREIWQLPPVENGDIRIIRGEYYNADAKVNEEEQTDEGNQSI